MAKVKINEKQICVLVAVNTSLMDGINHLRQETLKIKVISGKIRKIIITR